jgi:hypothetical protein
MNQMIRVFLMMKLLSINILSLLLFLIPNLNLYKFLSATCAITSLTMINTSLYFCHVVIHIAKNAANNFSKRLMMMMKVKMIYLKIRFSAHWINSFFRL